MTVRPPAPTARRPLPVEVPPGASTRERGDPVAFYAAVRAAFEQAVRSIGGHQDRHFQIAGQVVRLRFAGEALVAGLTRALAPLAIAPVAEPNFTIHLWDTASTGVEPPPPAWPHEDFQGNGAIHAFGTEDLLTTFQLGNNTLNVLDAVRGQAYNWVRDAARLPSFELGAPLRWSLHLWLRRQGVLAIHAGAIGQPAGGVLLVGRGGAGKSNTALSALDSDLQYAADDYCLISAEPEPTIHSLYSTGKAHAADLARLPFLAGRASNPHTLDSEKALYFLHEHFPDRLARMFPARAVLVPRITGRPATRAHLTSAAAGIAGLAPSTFAQLPGMQSSDFQVLVRFFRRVPSYLLELGTDREEIMAVVAELISALNAGQRPARVPA
jgi:hypothetical protein